MKRVRTHLCVHAPRRVSGHRIRRRTTRHRPSTRHRADLTLDEHTNLTHGNRSRGLLRRHIAGNTQRETSSLVNFSGNGRVVQSSGNK